MITTKINLATYDFAAPLRVSVTETDHGFFISLVFSPDEAHAARLAFRVPVELMEGFMQDVDAMIERIGLDGKTCQETPVRVN